MNDKNSSKNFTNKTMFSLSDLIQFVKYELLKQRYSLALPRTIRFESRVDKKANTVLFQAPDYPGLYTILSLRDLKTAIHVINDAIFTYFEVPRYIAKKTPNIFQIEGSLNRKNLTFTYPQGIAIA